MKGFINEFTESSDILKAQITELESQIKDKDKTIEDLKDDLALKDKALNEHEDMLTSLGKQLSKEKIENMKKDKTILELGKHEAKVSMELMKMKNEVNSINQSLDMKGGE